MTSTLVERPSSSELTDRVVLVTGAGSGLGAAIASVLAGAGASVVASDVRGEMVERLADELAGDGMAIETRILDVADERSARSALEAVMERHGRLDVLVNNAGIDRTASIDELTLAEFDRVVAVNLRGPFLLSRLVLGHMRERRRGHIVNIVSTAAKRAWPNAAAYHASKWGLLGLSHAMHTEARPDGVKVTAVIAGGMRTPFLLDRFPELDPALLQDPRNVAETVRHVLTQPAETVIPEVMVIPMHESSWP